jgi:tricorn protease
MKLHLFVILIAAQFLPAQGTRLLRHPALSKDSVAFEYAGDLWIAGRTGGDARRLTSTAGAETEPYFSPDGTQIAYTATVAGNTDVYVMPAAGGEPRRLTFHPGVDRVRGWTPDGRRVVFASARDSMPQESYFRLWTVDIEGGLAKALPMPRAASSSYSPDGSHIAYEEITSVFVPDWYERSGWRHYRGGRTRPIRVMNLADYSVEKLPWQDSNDTTPMWIGNTIYFLSDRNFTVNLFSYNTSSKQVKQLTHHDDFDIMTASAGPDGIVYEQAGYIHFFDVKSGQARQLALEARGDLPWAHPQFKKVAGMIRSSSLSPTGARAAFEARGDIFTVPTEKGDYRNLTQSPGVHDRNPVWSPDGAQLAWLSDAGGEYELMLGDPAGTAKPRAIPLPSTAYFSDPEWSPDGKQMLLQDNHRNLWLMEISSGKIAQVDTDAFPDSTRQFEAVWAPDSKWIAYAKNLPSHLRAIFIYSLEEGKSHQITDGLADSVSAAFDASGKYLYFLSSTDYGPHTSWLEMSSLDRPVRRAIYLAVLSASEPSPLLPETGEEPRHISERPERPERSAESARTTVPTVKIDFDKISQRIISLSVPPAEYSNLKAGVAGTIFYTQPAGTGQGAGQRLQKYQLKERAAATFLDSVRSYTLSGDRKKLLYQAGRAAGGWSVVPTDKPAKPGEGTLKIDDLQMMVDPRAEWAEIFRETWRFEREYFYDAKMHGANWGAVYEKYHPLLASVGHRADLDYLIAMVGSELTVGHSYLAGTGDTPGEEAPEHGGLLGADYTIENGKYRISHIYTGENWNPELRAPLSAPGIDVAEGDYLLEVNGRPLDAPVNVYSLFEGTAGRQTMIRVSKTPSLEGSRMVTVIPVASEDGLRTRAWIENNRRTVDRLSGGKLAYVWLPNTGAAGYSSFNRYYYAQQEKEGAVIDERYNHGGMVADYIVNELDRKLMGYFALRDGAVSTSPEAGIYGPKVMLINESAGSGGDALPYYFHLRKIGPLVGKRTWGGLVGTLGVPQTIDGGGITAPGLAFYDLSGKWAVENEGIAPDIEVENTPADVIKGHDPQLERAVAEAMKLLEQNPLKRMPRPAPIDRTSKK